MRGRTAIVLGLVVLFLMWLWWPGKPPSQTTLAPSTLPPASIATIPTPTTTAAIPPQRVTSSEKPKRKPKWAKAGPCRTPDDRAADGSRCGNRAASVRPGGK